MIKVADALITKALPAPLSSQPEIAAFAHALRNQLSKLAAAVQNIKIYSTSIDNASDEVLDILAVDLLITTYSQDYSIAVKRSLVKGALSNWFSNGTVSQLQSVVDSIFGKGSQIKEWFTTDEDPCTFKIVTDNPNITDKTVDEFIRIVELTKRLSAHLSGVELGMSVESMQQRYGFVVQTGTDIYLRQEE